MEGEVLLEEQYIEFYFERAAFQVPLETLISNSQPPQETPFQQSIR